MKFRILHNGTGGYKVEKKTFSGWREQALPNYSVFVPAHFTKLKDAEKFVKNLKLENKVVKEIE